MAPIIWLFCFAVLWTIVVDVQADAVQPLVMAVYVQKYKPEEVTHMDPKAKNYFISRITLTDAEEMNVDNLKLPLGDMNPTCIALLCGDGEKDAGAHTFIVKQVVDKIDLIDRNITCKYHLQPYIRDDPYDIFGIKYFNIGFGFKVTADLLFQTLGLMDEEEAVEAFKPLRKFANGFDIKSQSNYNTREYLKLEYNFYFNVPRTIIHTVVAHMHSITYEKECENIHVPEKNLDREERPREELVNKFKLKKAPPNYQWRQLVPMQDFKGIYTTQATCIYLNYLLLHEKTINSLEDIEISIRMVADVINEVSVVTRTYYSDEDFHPIPKIDEDGNTTPTIVCKEIAYFQNGKEYAILAFIHNKETKRMCDENIAWGWPDGNKNENEIGIGVMYYCSKNKDVLDKLRVRTLDVPLPFDLREVPYKDKTIDVLESIINNLSSPKIEKHSVRNRITNWLRWIKQSSSQQNTKISSP